MKQVIGRLRIIAAQTGCTILFLHHTNKASMFAGSGGEQQASRGSSVLVDNIRWQGYLRNMTTEEADQYGVDEDCRGFFTEFGVRTEAELTRLLEDRESRYAVEDPDDDEMIGNGVKISFVGGASKTTYNGKE